MSRYSRVPVIRDLKKDQTLGKRRFEGVKYPSIPLSREDIYVYASEGDRFDILVLQYYGDSSLWWVISKANENLPQNSYYLPLDIQIRIPSNVGAAVASYNNLNGI